MTKVEAEQLIAQVRQRLWAREKGGRRVLAGAILLCVPCVLLPGSSWLALPGLSWAAGYVSTICFVFWLAMEGFARLEKRDAHSVREAALWEEISKENGVLSAHNLALTELRYRILSLYAAKGASLLPLQQAVRLFDAFKRQQQRLQDVENRLHQLSVLRHKMAQLNRLDSSLPLAQVQPVAEQEAALLALAGQLKASCQRLENIVAQVEKAVQIEQLQREIDQLASRVQLASRPDVPEADDVERQITREIETYLQLERETERHFQQLR